MLKKNLLLKDIGIYGIGLVSAKSIVFLTIPIYTRLFSIEQYGTIELLITWTSIIGIFMNIGLDTALSYYFMETKNNNNSYSYSQIISSTLQLRILISIIIGFLIYILSPYIANTFFGNTVSKYHIMLTIIYGILMSLFAHNLEVNRLFMKPLKYVIISNLESIFTALSIILIARYLNWGIKGYILGMILGVFLTVFYSWSTIAKYINFTKFDVNLWKKFFAFGLPLLPASLLMWIMQASDRIFVNKLLPSSDLGLFAIGAKISMITVLFVQAFRKAWLPHAMDKMQQGKDGEKYISDISNKYLMFGSLIVILITITSPLLIRVIAPEEYYNAWKIIGIYSWSSIFYGYFTISLIGIFKSKKTYLSLIPYATGAILNLLLNYFLTIRFGILGTSLSTSIAIFVSNIIAFIISQKLYNITVNFKKSGAYFIMSWIVIYFMNTIF